MSKIKLIILSLSAVIMVSGCIGYKVDGFMHPQIKTIALGKIRNTTDQPRLSTYMKEKLKERFMQDASVKLVRLDQNPDVILTGKVRDYKARFSGTVSQDREDEDNGLFARISNVQLIFEYEVKTKRDWDVVSNTVTGTSEFTEVIDQLEEKRNALRRAAYQVSKTVVLQITEAW
jgi:hypothetical protein